MTALKLTFRAGDPWLLDDAPSDGSSRIVVRTRRAAADGSKRWLDCGIVVHGVEVGYLQATIVPGHQAWVAYLVGRRHLTREVVCTGLVALLRVLHREHGVRTVAMMAGSGNPREIDLLATLGFEPDACEARGEARPHFAVSDAEPLDERLSTARARPGPGWSGWLREIGQRLAA
ncbi:MAG TPA: hypothetical protein VMU33_11565 [Burkholderiaceae bacterium]|nr:hypothetical protein [Burkholderiaceae bacterium]